MPEPEIKVLCRERYNSIYISEKDELYREAITQSRNGRITPKKENGLEIKAQKEAIKKTTIEAMRTFPTEALANIWRAVYEVYIHRKSGVDDADTIAKVVSADQSWKKSSGHAFEEMIKFLASTAFEGTNIEIILQRDLNVLIKSGKLNNEPRDISWLKEQINASIFDLYAIVSKEDGQKFCFGCIQSKTSVRDRVTRDREPSIQAMASYFWSTIIVLDGDFLRLPKFISMVNGGTIEHPTNGWHGMYVFSSEYSVDRIYSTDLDLRNFKEHAIQAAQYWLTQRQWFNDSWRVTG